MTKTCSTCNTDLPLVAFPKREASKDGLNFECKKCARNRCRERHLKDPEKKRSWHRMHREANRLHSREVRNRCRLELKARNALSGAIARHKISRPDKCSVCGVQCEPQGHHYDYNKPLEVVWLCRRCHCHLHVQLNLIALQETIRERREA